MAEMTETTGITPAVHNHGDARRIADREQLALVRAHVVLELRAGQPLVALAREQHRHRQASNRRAIHDRERRVERGRDRGQHVVRGAELLRKQARSVVQCLWDFPFKTPRIPSRFPIFFGYYAAFPEKTRNISK